MDYSYQYVNTAGDGNLDRIVDKIKADPSLGPLYIWASKEGSLFTIFMSSALTNTDQSTLSNIVTTDVDPAPDPIDPAKQEILKAMEFGKNLMAEYGANNVITGLTTDQIKQIISATNKLQSALLSGSLNVALDELAAIPVPMVDANDPTITIITVDTVTDFRHKIQDYLGIART